MERTQGPRRLRLRLITNDQLQVEAPANPWMTFLEARAAALDYLHQEGMTDDDIASTMSIDAIKVQQIRTTHQLPWR